MPVVDGAAVDCPKEKATVLAALAVPGPRPLADGELAGADAPNENGNGVPDIADALPVAPLAEPVPNERGALGVDADPALAVVPVAPNKLKVGKAALALPAAVEVVSDVPSDGETLVEATPPNVTAAFVPAAPGANEKENDDGAPAAAPEADVSLVEAGVAALLADAALAEPVAKANDGADDPSAGEEAVDAVLELTAKPLDIESGAGAAPAKPLAAGSPKVAGAGSDEVPDALLGTTGELCAGTPR